MSKIIVDSFVKELTLNSDEYYTAEFVTRVNAVNTAYGYLYEKGILQTLAFEYIEYESKVMFAIDTEKLLPYRKELESSEISELVTAAREIFDVEYTPCLYSGAVEFAWTMETYREFDGTTERSWEIDPCRHMESDQVLDVLEIRENSGAIEAVKYIFKLIRDKKI